MDKESLTGLLMLFFVDSTKLNTGSLQKIIKSLCYHPPTCDFIIWALLAIFEHLKTDENQVRWAKPSVGSFLLYLVSHVTCRLLGSCEK